MRYKLIIILSVIIGMTFVAAGSYTLLDRFSADAEVYEADGSILVQQQAGGYIKDDAILQQEGYDIEMMRENGNESWVISEQD